MNRALFIAAHEQSDSRPHDDGGTEGRQHDTGVLATERNNATQDDDSGRGEPPERQREAR
jgi:hypothetical protein